MPDAAQLADIIHSAEGITFETQGEGESTRYVTKGMTFAVAGKWTHPFWGEMDMSESVLRAFKRNFDNRVLNTDVMIDERHDRGRALGWIKSLGSPKKADLGGKEYIALQGDVEWTPEGRALLENKSYKYFSPEFGSYTTPDLKTQYDNVLLGGALTNRPFLKMMPSVKFGDGDDKGTAKNVFMFSDGDPKEGDKDWQFTNDLEVEPFTKSYKRTDPKDPEPKEEQVTLEEFLAQLKKDTGVEFGDAAAVVSALKAGASADGQNETLRAKLKEAGIQFDDKTATADVVTAIITTQGANIKTLSEKLESITTTLTTDRRNAAVGLLIRNGQILPADRKVYEDMYDKDVAMFESVTGTLKKASASPVMLGEIGGPGAVGEPGESVEYADEEKANEKGRSYLKMIGITPKSEATVK